MVTDLYCRRCEAGEPCRRHPRVGEANRWRATIAMSSDHAGIGQELAWLERDILAALARIDDPRQVRAYIRWLEVSSFNWCHENKVDMRGWIERTRKAAE